MADDRLKAVATAQAYDQGNIASLDDAMTRRLVASTVLTESYGGDLDPVNRLGYVGRYQAGAAWLADAGYINLERYREARAGMSARDWERGGGQLRFMQDAGNWNDGLSLDRYIASDDLQDRAFRINCNRSYRQAISNGLLDGNASPETVAGFLKARHLSGYEGARSVVQGGRVIRDENGTSNYDYYHDITRNRDGLNALMGRTQESPEQARTTQGAQPPANPRAFDDIMRTMLPTQGGVDPHVTSRFGQRTLNGRADDHGGVDFNYVGGQAGVNLRHPTVHAPVSGVVVFSGGQYGTVKIRDDQGNLHEVLHLDARAVQVTDPPTRVQAGDPIGTMGGRGPNGAGQYAQHVHYQVREAGNLGTTVDPVAFWNGRTVDTPARPGSEQRTPGQPSPAPAQSTLRIDDRGPQVIALQESLNRLGYTGRDGRPLETRSGIFGPDTRHAVESLQRAHGLLPDGVVGRDTRGALASAAERPLLSEATHPAHGLYAAFARQLPPSTRPEQVANVTMQAMENGIDRPERIGRVDVAGSNVLIRGSQYATDPGDRAAVDLGAPTASLQQVSDHVRQQAIQQEQERNRQQPAPVQDDTLRQLRVPVTMMA